MTLENELVIRGKRDTCAVRKYANGSFYVGGITLDADEIQTFLSLLHEALVDRLWNKGESNELKP